MGSRLAVLFSGAFLQCFYAVFFYGANVLRRRAAFLFRIAQLWLPNPFSG
jgi:hypothetical protein